ncbi:MAG: hypothetical protein WCO54_04835 [Bacteroidota bacterium]
MDIELTDIEYDILNTVYFVESFEHIVDECNAKPPIVADVIKQLIHKKLIVPMKWDEPQNDFVRSVFYDSDNMHAYHYLITKDGLEAHNTK